MPVQSPLALEALYLHVIVEPSETFTKKEVSVELFVIVKLSPSCPSSWTKKIPPSIEYSTVTYTVPPELLLKDRVEVL